MAPRAHLELLSRPGGAPGSAGFKLTGVAREGTGMCRVWLRRSLPGQRPWDRYLDPRFRSDEWDVRCFTKTDSAFSLVEEFSPASLDALCDVYAFDGAGTARGFGRNGDPVHDTVVDWMRRATGSSAAVPPGEAETMPPGPDTPAVAGEATPAPAAAAPAPPVAAAPPVAEAAPVAVSVTVPPPATPAPEPAPEPAASPTPEPAAKVAAEVTDAWDEIAEMAERATGSHVAAKEAPADTQEAPADTQD